MIAVIRLKLCLGNVYFFFALQMLIPPKSKGTTKKLQLAKIFPLCAWEIRNPNPRILIGKRVAVLQAIQV